MSISQNLELTLRKRYEPSALISMRYKGNDVVLKTDPEGNAITMFLGEKDAEGRIKGYRYLRTLKKDSEGRVIKDHWERKGKC